MGILQQNLLHRRAPSLMDRLVQEKSYPQWGHEAWTAGTTVTAVAPTPAWAYVAKISVSWVNGAHHSATMPVIRPTRAFP
jgi:hypothetical protein